LTEIRGRQSHLCRVGSRQTRLRWTCQCHTVGGWRSSAAGNRVPCTTGELFGSSDRMKSRVLSCGRGRTHSVQGRATRHSGMAQLSHWHQRTHPSKKIKYHFTFIYLFKM